MAEAQKDRIMQFQWIVYDTEKLSLKKTKDYYVVF